MTSFITTPSTIISIHTKTTPVTCSLNKNVFPRPSRSRPIMQTGTPNDQQDNDDDATMGATEGPALGFGMGSPPLSPSERIYLDGAKNNKEYMARIMEIARKKEQEHAAEPSQTPDDYVKSLSRSTQPAPDAEYGGPRIDPTDEYMENLSRMYRNERGIQNEPLPENRRSATAPAGPVLDPELVANPTDSVAEVEDKMHAIEAEIQQVSGMNQSEEGSVAQEVMERLDEMAKMREMDDDDDDDEDDEDMTLEEGARKIAELQRQIREAAGLEEDDQVTEVEVSSELVSEDDSEPESNSEPSDPEESSQQSRVGQDPSTVDKQIDFLEHYLSKLQKEATEDPEANAEQSIPPEPTPHLEEEMQSTMSNVAEQISKMPTERTSFKGLESTPGEMSAEEKMAVFEQLRRQAASAQPTSDFADPFNVTLPERTTENADDGNQPSPESEAEYDSFESSFGDKSLLIEEIETEVKAFSRDVKALLQKHETRLQVLLSRLRAL